ncbi:MULTISPECIES: hypothetical protein [Pseudomonas syringae group]|uniref:Uncharacterized protein n=1 Tax=Pseudomonas syringae pv. avii TaxID=663959 RepID=A0A3M5VLW5_PSESX|nr:hypothetical protein ALP29_201023 [Pseudomonas syringae pv. avii]
MYELVIHHFVDAAIKCLFNDIIRMLCQAFQAFIHGLHHHFHVLGRLTIAKLMIDSPVKRRCVHAQSEVLVVIKVTKLWIFILTLQ